MIDKIIYIIVGIFVVFIGLFLILITMYQYQPLIDRLWNMQEGMEDDDRQRIEGLQEVEDSLEKMSGSSSSYCLFGGNYCEGISTDKDGLHPDGTGWVKANLTSYYDLSSLPRDPISMDRYYYRYCSDGKTWELNARFMSDKYKTQAETDGGTDASVYELGTNLNICK